MTVRKAVIAAAGLGTRMYPITKTIDKAMLPLGRRPAIDYMIRECARAGVEQIAIVVREGSTQIQHYYGCDSDLRELLALRGWEDKATALDETASVPELVFLEQSLKEGYGTAIPVLLAREFVGDDSFFYLSSDDLLADESGASTLASLAETAGDSYGIVGQPATPENLGRYGLLATEEIGGALYLRGIAEKAKEVPDDGRPLLINISRYVFPATFFATLASVETDPGSGEIYLTDGLAAVSSADPEAVRVQRSHGDYFDLGSVDGLVAAVNYFSTAEREAENSSMLSPV
ncbi:sugar phosphate nucleotidyltransferase [Nocardia sp. NPDC003726]